MLFDNDVCAFRSHSHTAFVFTLENALEKSIESPKIVIGICWLMGKKSHDIFNWYHKGLYKYTLQPRMNGQHFWLSYHGMVISFGFLLLEINQFKSKICSSVGLNLCMCRRVATSKSMLNTVYTLWDDWYFRPMSLVNWQSNSNRTESEKESNTITITDEFIEFLSVKILTVLLL